MKNNNNKKCVPGGEEYKNNNDFIQQSIWDDISLKMLKNLDELVEGLILNVVK